MQYIILLYILHYGIVRELSNPVDCESILNGIETHTIHQHL
jgi:hypothetical protein